MKRKLILIVLLLVPMTFQLAAQTTKTKSLTVQCGNQFTQEFGGAADIHEFKIKLDAGDMLSVKAIPTGDYLNMRIEIYDPTYTGQKYSSGMLFPEGNRYSYVEPMFTNHARRLDVLTGKVSATGTYTILLYNNYKTYKKDARAGEYTINFSCTKKNGTIIESQ